MISIECDCGQRAYMDWLLEDEKGDIYQSMDVDTMGLDYGEEGVSFTCPSCKKTFHIVEVV